MLIRFVFPDFYYEQFTWPKPEYGVQFRYIPGDVLFAVESTELAPVRLTVQRCEFKLADGGHQLVQVVYLH